jgi:hypothetical protein
MSPPRWVDEHAARGRRAPALGVSARSRSTAGRCRHDLGDLLRGGRDLLRTLPRLRGDEARPGHGVRVARTPGAGFPSLVRRPVPPRQRERERTWVARRLPLYAATPDG